MITAVSLSHYYDRHRKSSAASCFQSVSSKKKSLILVMRQKNSSEVKGSQPVRGNLLHGGKKTPQGSLHILSIVARGQDRVK